MNAGSRRANSPKWASRAVFIGLGLVVLAGLGIGYAIVRTYLGGRNSPVFKFIYFPQDHQDWVVPAGSRCGDAPFSMPTSGFIGYLWGDSFKLFTQHQGLDIFAGTMDGVTPVYAPYDGYLTREAGWVSTVIIRVPDDPLEEGRQIWLYMTHLATADGQTLIDAKFPEGASEVPVKAGDLIGYQGSWSGDPQNPVGVHLHFSIVKDDGQGHYLNELKIQNTLDPSPYFGFPLNARSAPGGAPMCPER